MLRSRPTRRFAARMRGAASAAVLTGAVFASATALAETLIIKSEPPGASIFLDDEPTPRARTPCALTDVARGAHKVRATLPGYRDKVRMVFVIPSKAKTVEFRFATDEEKSSEPTSEPAPPPAPRPKPVFKRPSAKPKTPRSVEVSCPFCRGGGLIKEVGCVTCRATGYVKGEQCGKCSGSGRGAYSCPYCKGKGELAAGGRQGACRPCAGKGSPPCGGCAGKGSIPRPNPEAAGSPTTECVACGGEGCLQKAKCIVCAGRGQIRVGNRQEVAGAGGGGGGGNRDRNNENRVRWVNCRFCDGKGECAPVCRRCFGRGYVGSGKRLRACNFCWGTGRAWIPCRACGGRGWVRGK